MICGLPTLALLSALSGVAEAGVQRFAMLVANNEGALSGEELVFAEDDARKMEAVLVTNGGYDRDHVRVLTGDRRADVLQEFGDLRHEIEVAQAHGDQTIFLFYYSGHADDDGLQLGRTRLEYEELERMLDNSGAEVRLAFLDACSSGQMTRRKGGTLAPSFVFDVSERLNTSGSVIITSSSGDEASQESDVIGGSVFTYYLVGGMSGLADDNRDDKVTLSEAYNYVYNATVSETADSRLGTQHPTFEWDLAGEGDVVLTDLDPARSGLRFPATMTGTYAVFDKDRKMFVGEVTAGGGDRRLAVRPGVYLIQVRYPTHLSVAELRVGADAEVDVSGATFEAVDYRDDVAKGSIDRQVRAARRPDSSVRMLFGAAGPTNPDVAAQYLPPAGVAGLSYRMDWRKGQWFSVDLLGGAGAGDIAIPGVTTQTIPARSATTTLGAQAGYASPEWKGLQAGGGVRGAVTWWGRTTYESGVNHDQYLTAISPGLMWFAGWHPGRFVLDIEWHRNFVPYQLDSGAPIFGTREVLLGVGMKW
ncbi:MAG: caspase family protein [Alphaproteobacteria bacterium]|nr:caspase family protein [Alphaproteobacteria bacterium]